MFQRFVPGAVSLCLIAGCAGWPFGGGAVADNSQAERIIRAYDLDGMLAQVGPIIRDSLDSNLPASVPADKRRQLDAVIDQVYAPERLAQDMAQRLQQRAVERDQAGKLAVAAQTVGDPLVGRMVANEQAAETEAFATGFQAFLQQPRDPAEEPRLARMRELISEMHLVDLQIEFNAGMLRGMVAARNEVVPSDYEVSAENRARMLDQTRESLRERLPAQLPTMLLYAHREVSDEDVYAYLALHDQPGMRWVNRALPAVLADTLTAAAERLAGTYPPPSADARRD